MVIIALILGIVAFLNWPHSITEEERIQQLISRVEEGVESAQLATVMQSISKSYMDPEGLSHTSLKGFLFQQFRKRGSVALAFSPLLIKVHDKKAHISFEVAILESEKEKLIGLPINSEALHFEVDLQKEEGEWKIISHTREYIFGED